MLYDLRTLNHDGVWMTDTVTSSKRYAQERGKTLTPRFPAVQIIDSTGRRVFLDDR